MNIGFVSTWFERGAAYVTKSYIELLKNEHNCFVYARGGESRAKNNKNWDADFVTWAPKLQKTHIKFYHIKKWIEKNNIEVLFFNEQHEINIVYKIKKKYPNIKIGAYIDYYKENTVKDFMLYDFLICNTKRHFSVFKEHPQVFYVPWGTNTELFKMNTYKKIENIVFFHSAGLSNRKGTSFVIECFIEGGLYKKSKLIIHSQKELDYSMEKLEKYNIEVIIKTVPAPGLYYLGDVFVYPTMLDGLGLTMYEALSSGLPVITTNSAPMNEVINDRVGRLVDVEYYRTRADAYYWPLAIVNKKSLTTAMWYYVENKIRIDEFKARAREEATVKWNWVDRKETILNIFEESKIIVLNPSNKFIKDKDLSEKIIHFYGSSYTFAVLKKIKSKLF